MSMVSARASGRPRCFSVNPWHTHPQTSIAPTCRMPPKSLIVLRIRLWETSQSSSKRSFTTILHGMRSPQKREGIDATVLRGSSRVDPPRSSTRANVHNVWQGHTAPWDHFGPSHALQDTIVLGMEQSSQHHAPWGMDAQLDRSSP